jgi:hypothetical protein
MMIQRLKYPAWLSQVENIAETPAIIHARQTREEAVTPAEQVDAENVYCATVLASIAEAMDDTARPD